MEKRRDTDSREVRSGNRGGTPPWILQGVEMRLRKLRWRIGDWGLGSGIREGDGDMVYDMTIAH